MVEFKTQVENGDLETTVKEKYSILFVDDEKNVLRAMIRVFRHENYNIFSADSPAKALEILKTENIHVVISRCMRS